MRPAEYAVFPDEEEPTQPGTPKPSDRFDTVARLFSNLTPDERSRAAVLLDNWFRCPANRRVLLEATAAEFSD